jgi:hypothetical protein
MEGVAHGSITPPKGLSRAKAAEYVSGQSPKGLPQRAPRTRYREAFAGAAQRQKATR